jgi:hypothetical protein
LARARGAPPALALQDRRAAAKWLEESLAAWKALESDPAFSPPQRREMQDVEKALAEIGKP